MTNYTNVYGGTPVQVADVSYIAVVLIGNITLNWPTQFQDTNLVVAHIMDITPSANGFTITMPDARDSSTGQDVLFVNVSGTHSFSILDNTGALISLINANNSFYMYLTDNTTQAGSWRVIAFALGVPVISSIGATSLNNNLTIVSTTTNPITSAGVFNFNFANDLLALTGLGANTGLATRTAANTWVTRSLSGTANQIIVTNPAGIAGNPTIALSPAITGINSITVGNLNLTANTISSIDIDGNINFSPNGAGTIVNNGPTLIRTGNALAFYNVGNTHFISFSAGGLTNDVPLIWPTTVPADGQVLAHAGAGALAWENVTTFGGPSTVNAIPRYSNTIGGLENSGVLLSDANEITGVVSLTAQNIVLGALSGNTISTVAGNLILTPNGASEVQSTNNLNIQNSNFLKLMEPTASGTNYIAFNAGAMAANVNVQYPTGLPAVGNILQVTSWTSPNAVLSWRDPSHGNNWLINPNMDIWQANTTITSGSTYAQNNNDTYFADGWILLSDGNNIVNVSRDVGTSGANYGAEYSCSFVVATANHKWGMLQILENMDSSPLTNKTVSISFAASATGVSNIRAAVLSWTGPSDNVTSSAVTAWNGLGVNPTLAANWTYENVAVNIPLGGGYVWQSVNSINIDTPGTNNIALFIWIDDTTAAVNARVNITSLKLEVGAAATTYSSLPISDIILRCKRYFQKDLALDKAVMTPNTLSVDSIMPLNTTQPFTLANNCIYAAIPFNPVMRATPTFVTYAYNTTTTTTAGTLYNGAYVDQAANSAAALLVDQTGALLQNTSGSIAGITYWVSHWYADARL